LAELTNALELPNIFDPWPSRSSRSSNGPGFYQRRSNGGQLRDEKVGREAKKKKWSSPQVIEENGDEAE
jgi:hypothetical protein